MMTIPNEDNAFEKAWKQYQAQQNNLKNATTDLNSQLSIELGNNGKTLDKKLNQAKTQLNQDEDFEKSWQQYQSSSIVNSQPTQKPSFKDQVKNFAQNAYNSIPAPVRDVGEFAASIPIGAMQTVSDLASGLQRGSVGLHNLLQNDNMAAQQAPNFAQYAPNQEAEALGEIAGGFALPITKMSGIANLAGKIPAVGKALAPYVPTALQGAGYGAIFSAANPENTSQDIGMGALLGAGIPIGLQAAGRGLVNAGGINPLNKLQREAEIEKDLGINRDERTFTPQEAKENVDLAKEVGVNPTLGQISNSQRLNEKFAKNANQPFSSERGYAAQFTGKVGQYAQNIYNDLFQGISHEKANPEILKQVNQVYDANKARSSANYNNISNLAVKEGIMPSRENAEKYAAQVLKNSNLMNKANIIDPLSGENEVIKILNTASKPVAENYPYTFDVIKDERTAIGELLEKVRESSPKSTSAQKVLENLYSKYTQDMENSLKGTPLDSVWKEANKYHRENVTPFRKDNLPYYLNEERSEKIVPELINKSVYQPVIKMLSPETRKLILGSELMKGATGINKSVSPEGETFTTTVMKPTKLGSSYRNLNTKKNANLSLLEQGLTHTIDGKEMPLATAMNKLDNLNKMKEPISKIAKNIPKGLDRTMLMEGIAGAGLGEMIGGGSNLLPALAGGAATVGLGSAKSILQNKYLKNPKVIEAYLNPDVREQMIRQQALKMIPSFMRKLNYPAGISELLNREYNQ